MPVDRAEPDESVAPLPSHWNFNCTEGNYDLLPHGTDLHSTDEVYRESTWDDGHGASGHWEPVGDLKHYAVVGGAGYYICRRPKTVTKDGGNISRFLGETGTHTIPKTDDSGIDVGDTTSGNVHVSVFHGEERASIIIDPDHATRVAERLWDCAATGRAVQMENQPQDSIP